MPPSSPKGLPRSFWALNISQFLGAMNDNAYRWVMAWALVTRASIPGQELNESAFYIAGVVFALPYILFSSAAGVLADRFSKRRLIVLLNLMQVAVMTLGLFAFMANQPILIYSALFLMALQSALFSPNKLGILAETVPREKLSYANGLMETFVYMAIILGTILGGGLFGLFGASEAGSSTFAAWQASIFFIFFATVGFLVSLFVRDTGVRASGKKPILYFWKDVARNLRATRSNRYLFLSLFAIGFFLFLGAFVQFNVPFYGTKALGLTKPEATNLFLALAFGIGAGSFLAGKISRRAVEIGLVPIGALMVSTGLLLFLVPIHSVIFAVAVLFFLGMGGGFYIVPLHTYLQDTAPEKDRGELIATANFLSFCGMGIASGLLILLEKTGLDPSARFALLGILTLGLTFWVVKILPDFFIRFIGLMTARIVYRLETIGVENVPMQGGALLVCNHVSYVDAVLLGASHPRRVRFLMAREIFQNRLFGWLFRLMQAIPISQNDPPKQVVQSLHAARRALDEGYLVCIFGEGSLTRTGYIMEFKRGIEHILKGTQYPVIPCCLHGIWGSILSYSEGRILGRLPRPLRRRVTVSFGKPLPSDSNAFDIRQKVMELHSEAFERDRARRQPLPVEFARVARSRWRRFCMADTTGKEITFGKTLVSSLALADRLRAPLEGQECVGLLLPSSVGGALANLAVSFLGKAPVNLNYTAPSEAVHSAIGQCRIRHVITSRAFLEKVKFENLPGPIFLEDLPGEITRAAKIRAFLKALLFPPALLLERGVHVRRPGVDDTAAIIFSSGSTGEPKGVVLSHYNILSNAESAQQVIRLQDGETVCGVLPFFHSFGYTVTLWLPLLVGIGVAYHYNPMEAETVGKLVADRRCSLLAATPTFLLAYIRKIPPERFQTLRVVITGAEKLKPRIADAFKERFGLAPMEGYGTTELSPIASVNLPGVNVGGMSQEASKPGSIGRPIPGVTMKVVEPDNPDRVLGYGEEGLLLVKGPNVMKGYLGRPDLTAEVIRDGWYATGDMARIDHDGFVTITDRLSRFSKIGGEMIPHQAIEEKLQELLGTTDSVCAVTAAPDEKKGEQLVVLLTPDAGDPAEAHRLLQGAGLPNLWIPPRKNFFTIESIPFLGSGKVDLKGLKKLAEEKLASSSR